MLENGLFRRFFRQERIYFLKKDVGPILTHSCRAVRFCKTETDNRGRLSLQGAVTHVLIDDSQKGYGIFAENMLETTQSVGEGLPLPSNEENLKDAS